jgi:hypothetical protein
MLTSSAVSSRGSLKMLDFHLAGHQERGGVASNQRPVE